MTGPVQNSLEKKSPDHLSSLNLSRTPRVKTCMSSLQPTEHGLYFYVFCFISIDISICVSLGPLRYDVCFCGNLTVMRLFYITVLENEYGSYYACDKVYTAHLRDQAVKHLRDDVILFTTDGSSDSNLKCGKIENVYATVDFGITYNPAASFKPQRDYEPNGPLVNSEFYTGWLDHWGQPHSTRDLTKVSQCLDLLLKYGANVNMYMFEGGTNFGYWSGANYPNFMPQPTSYDYDAPLSEAGDITDKYIVLRQIISKYTDIPYQPMPNNTRKAAYGKVQMEFMGTVQDLLSQLSPKGAVKSEYPLSMEDIGQYQGFALYRHVLKGDTPSEPKSLEIKGVKDRAWIMLNKVPQGVFDRNGQLSMNLTLKVGMTIDILVENMGHINFGSGMNNESKGLVSNVTFGGSMLTGWDIYAVSPEKFNVSKLTGISGSGPLYNGNLSTPSIYVGKINVPDEPADTFLDASLWTKGQAIVSSKSNFNLGRYWPYVGPQVRLYVPKPSLQALPVMNNIILFELERSPCDKSENCYVQFMDQPYVNGTAHGPALFKDFDKYFPWNRYH
ncbi:hypothetical protein FSP39_008416 [Pinctada imbricata]|uniref:Beta-galactosidase n=1 Tax=Pinctada imbricata TaxID=66713 RepID=A0AA88YM36_PINIB|nr:hypothetical protein FSP39_008416 [Pinctada imbricata]